MEPHVISPALRVPAAVDDLVKAPPRGWREEVGKELDEVHHAPNGPNRQRRTLPGHHEAVRRVPYSRRSDAQIVGCHDPPQPFQVEGVAQLDVVEHHEHGVELQALDERWQHPLQVAHVPARRRVRRSHHLAPPRERRCGLNIEQLVELRILTAAPMRERNARAHATVPEDVCIVEHDCRSRGARDAGHDQQDAAASIPRARRKQAWRRRLHASCALRA
eukprot:6728245-Prymnesium_polylepis.2